MTEYKDGEIVEGCVTGIKEYGIFVALENNYSGLIHISEISNSYIRNINDYIEIGEKIKVLIKSHTKLDKHLNLSIKNINYRINNKKVTKIIETRNGFSTLKNNLNIWIAKKEEEISQQSCKS